MLLTVGEKYFCENVRRKDKNAIGKIKMPQMIWEKHHHNLGLFIGTEYDSSPGI